MYDEHEEEMSKQNEECSHSPPMNINQKRPKKSVKVNVMVSTAIYIAACSSSAGVLSRVKQHKKEKRERDSSTFPIPTIVMIHCLQKCIQAICRDSTMILKIKLLIAMFAIITYHNK